MKRFCLLLVVFVFLFVNGCSEIFSNPTPTLTQSVTPEIPTPSLTPTNTEIPPTFTQSITPEIPKPSLTPTITEIPPTPTQQPKPPLVLQKGPYLLFSQHPEGMQVMWQSEQLIEYKFEWGTDETYSSGSFASPGDVETHLYRVELSGLIPGTHYYYRISTNQEETWGDFFSPDTDSTKLVFYAFGDTRSGPDTHDLISASILSQINSDPAAQTFVVSTGDLMDYAEEQNLQKNEFSPEQTSLRTMLTSFPVVNVVGNHDDIAMFKKYFPYPFTPRYDWSFDYGPAHFTIINQYFDLKKGSKRWKWLRNDLSSSTKPWKFILLHEPGWSAGSHDNNKMVQEVIQPLAEKYGVNMVIAGHNHYYARAVVNAVVHLTTGGGGAPLYTPGTDWPGVEKTIMAYHYVKLIIKGDTLKIQAVSPEGEILDEYSITYKENK